ncbi:AAA domain-containing protein [Pseudomonas aeruginosa]|uniref:AAA domain-containing protein n=1 Tax=Pseudomonas TaxID=286 RepID=UPI0021573780|nr:MULTISPECIES: AAA domain-containing protein [Pseudomonas]MDY1366055.1 AAA domain-containing protein [Pseudomonas aeruginosa]HCF7102776.1 helicase [Pseudomonas aeruginosa]HCU0576118.1 helicase [Pseudomonas aeruginosa]HEH8483308.1 helicase [Pseudomonas aeruginosa]
MLTGNEIFLKKYDHTQILSTEEPENGKPLLIIAEYKDKPVLIKYWPNNGNDRSNILEDIWLYEIRQLHRLKGYPGLGELISAIIDSGKDSSGFYLVLDVGMRVPLSHALLETRTLSYNKPWIKKLQDPEIRIKFWQNIIRIAKAIQLLHSQGLLHRHLDEDSILTDLSQTGNDFQLTGFEWSIRVQNISGAGKTSPSDTNLPIGRVYSFLTDWADLGHLIAKLLKINIETLNNLDCPVRELVSQSGLILDEVIFLRGLTGRIKLNANIPKEGMDGDAVVKKIESIIASLRSMSTKRTNKNYLIFHFNQKTSDPGKTHRKTSVFGAVQSKFNELYGVTLREENFDDCIKFVEEDLRNDPRLIYLPAENDLEEEIILVGDRLTYILNKNKESVRDIEGSWAAAFCHSAYLEPPKRINNSKRSCKLSGSKIHCMTSPQFKQSRDRIEMATWENIILKLKETEDTNLANQNIIDGFSAYHLTEIAYAKSEIYPMDLIAYQRDGIDTSLNTVILTSRSDSESQEITEALGLKPAANRLNEILTNELSDSGSWILVSNTNFSDEEQEIVLDFQRSEKQSNGVIYYHFTTTSLDPAFDDYFIISSSVQGTISQLSRRAGAIDALSNHVELVNMLTNPYSTISASHDKYSEHAAFNALDNSKQDVFKRIISTLPLYLVQGPPGVGKTFLVTALVQQIFTNEPDSRLLLTAQSHSTVQHLYKEVVDSLKSSTSHQDEPLIVSCIKASSQNNDTDPLSELDSLAKDYLISLTKSALFESSGTVAAKEKIIAMCGDNARSHRYTLISQLLKAANMVFATTNSRQVEELIKARSQFDWSIMEETGKVTGIELLSPLLLSYRRLMIGDHKQLPPYASEKMRQILQNKESLHSALRIAVDVYNNSIKGETIKSRFTDEYVQELSDENLNNLSREALRLHLLFESLIGEEEKAKENSIALYGSDVKHKPIASMLSIQHRMHPDISNLVSEVFYKKELTTAPNKDSYYRATPTKKPFYFCNSKPLENTPAILWIDIPDIQANRNFHDGEELPRWHNSLERNVIIEMLGKLRATSSDNNEKPKLAILSPYAQQVKKLAKDIDRKISNSNYLRNLASFAKPDDHISYCSTVDGFQGAEADVVIISMVRNNSFSYSNSALGFLLDSRRMNVLLSRAKHQIIIVGSLEFINNWSNKIEHEEIAKGLEKNRFVVKLAKALERYQAEGIMKRIEYREIIRNRAKNNNSHQTKA